MTRTLLAVLIVLAVAAVLGFWFLGRAPEAPPTALAPRTPAAPAQVASSDGEPLLREPAQQAVQPVESGQSGQAATFARQAQGEALPDGPAMELVAIDFDTREPLPETEFRWATVAAARVFWEGDDEPDAVDVEQVLQQIGRVLVADEEGIVSLPWPGEAIAIAARNEDHFGAQLALEYEAGPIEVELFPDLALDIQTLTQGGEPLPGIPVGLFRMRGGGDGERSVWTSVTEGGDAIATMPHAYWRLHREFERFDVYAAVNAFTAENPVAPLDTQDWPEAPLKLIVPPLGSVAVDVTDENGSLPRGPVIVDMHLTGDQGRDIAMPDNGGGRRMRVETDTGSALFEHVGTGLNLRVRARSVWARSGEIVVPGPLEAGEVVAVAIELGEFHPGISVRLLDQQGAPLASRTIETRLSRETSSYSTKLRREETDSEGRLELPIGMGIGKRRALRLTLLDEEEDTPLLRGEIDLTRELPEGVTDLGDIELEPLPSVVEGLVVNRQGLPVALATLTVRSATGESDSGNWRPVPGLEAKSDESGRFEIRGDVPAGGWLRLYASKGDHTPAEPVEFAAGARGVEIVLDQAGALAGSVILHEGVPFRDVIVDALENPTGERWVVRRATRLLRSNTFQIDDLPAGAYAVRVRRAGDPVALWEAFGVTVYGGEVSYDPRLQDIDLRDTLFSVRVEVVNHRLEPMEHGRVRVISRSADVRASSVAYAIEEGEAQVVSRERSHDMEIAAEGFTTVVLHGVDSDRRVVLEPAIRVRIQLPQSVKLPKPPFYLRPMLVPDVTGTGKRSKKLERQAVSVYGGGLRVSRQHPLHLGGEPVFGDNRVVQLVVRQPGRQILEFVIVRRSGERYRGVRTVQPPKNRRLITVTPTDDGRLYRAEPDPKSYQRALKKARR